MPYKHKSKFDRNFLLCFKAFLIAGIVFLLVLLNDPIPEEVVVPEPSPEPVVLEVSEGLSDDGIEPEEVEEVIELPVTPKGVLSPSNLTPDELEEGLLNSLKDYSDAFIQAEKETGVNAVFLSAVAALESGWAESNVCNTYNNLFGWTAKDGFKSFDSKEECILFVASRLKDLYLTEGAVYFNGYEVEDINVCYNGRQHWEDNVNQIMSQIEYRIERSKIPC